MSLSWKPIRRGHIYCSTACGGGCTKAAHDAAQRNAKRLLRKLKGKGWRIDVWENLGWHFRLLLGPLQITERDGQYWTLMSDTPESGGGSYLWATQTESSDPNRAVRLQVRKAREKVEQLHSLVKGVEDALK